MLESPAYRALSLSAHRVISRIEVELGHHGGTDNGKLPVTYDDFQKYGIHRHAIASAIRECVALGFLEITEPGRAGNAEFRAPNLFRLTYAYASGTEPTHDWQRIETEEQALVLSHAARQPIARSRKNRIPVPVKASFSAGNHHRKPSIHSTETGTTGHGTETITTSISRVGGDD
jgi:hypothetical protein